MSIYLILSSILLLTINISCDEVPQEIDWRDRGVVTKVKDQGNCEGSFYFAALGLLEIYYYQQTGEVLDLSEQSALDCSGGYNGGCSGGGVINTLDFVRNKGAVLEKDYPYVGSVGTCQMDSSKSILKYSGYVMVPRNEEKIKTVVGTIGPVAVTFTSRNLSAYSGGVYIDPNCHLGTYTYSGIIVGYGTTDDGVDYWTVKMSFGSNWGEEGYIRMLRNAGNQCGIADNAIYPTL